jgi:diguanylate cyclase (GGDEF)-like protein
MTSAGTKLGSLRRRFTWTAAAVAGALALAAGVASYVLAYRNVRLSARDTIVGLVGSVQKTAAIGAYAGDRVLLEEIAAGLAQHPMVARVRVDLLAGSGVEAAGQRVLDPSLLTSADAQALLLDQPLVSPFDADEVVGRLWVQGDPMAVQQEARTQALWLAVPMALQVLLLALLLDAIAARLLTRPLRRLATQVGRLHPGTSERLAVARRHQHDEIGLLAVRSNELLAATAQALDTERELRAEVSAIEGELRQLLEASSAAIFVLDRQGHLLRSNPTLARICAPGTGRASLPSGTPLVQQAFHDPDRVRAVIDQACRDGHPVGADLRLLDGPDGERWAHGVLSVLPASDASAAVRIEGVLYDVTQRRRDEHQALHRASHDGLTGLHNRSALMAELERSLQAVRASGGGLSLFYLDLDGFKQVNDQLGHAAGDAVLVECASRLRQAVRRHSDMVVRLGGDEFVVLLQAPLSEPWVSALAWRIVAALAEPVPLAGGASAQVGASLGVASCPVHAHDAESLLREADRAMYEVKRRGKRSAGDPSGLTLPREDVALQA